MLRAMSRPVSRQADLASSSHIFQKISSREKVVAKSIRFELAEPAEQAAAD